jgi:hypothetical protein
VCGLSPTYVCMFAGDVTEGDLQELFRPFGPISRVFLAVDRATGENRGFAFVNYHVRCVDVFNAWSVCVPRERVGTWFALSHCAFCVSGG